MIPLGVIQGGSGGTPPPEDIHITTDSVNVVLLDLFEALYPPAVSGQVVNFFLDAGVRAGGDVGISTGVWATGVILNFTNNSDDLRGKGGGAATLPDDGGVAFKAEFLVNVDNQGTISGGGGGGANSKTEQGSNSQNYRKGGGGGAGYPGGSGGSGTGGADANGSSGGSTLGGDPGTFHSDPNQPSLSAGHGGDIATAGGGADTGNSGGAAGAAVQGGNLINWINNGTIVGVIEP